MYYKRHDDSVVLNSTLFERFLLLQNAKSDGYEYARGQYYSLPASQSPCFRRLEIACGAPTQRHKKANWIQYYYRKLQVVTDLLLLFLLLLSIMFIQSNSFSWTVETELLAAGALLLVIIVLFKVVMNNFFWNRRGNTIYRNGSKWPTND